MYVMLRLPSIRNALSLLLIVLVVVVSAETYYETLGLRKDASLKDIKKAYRRLAMEHHPDRNKGNEEEATLIFRKVSEAYEVLSDEQKRKDYDDELKTGRASGGRASWQQGDHGFGGGQRRSRHRPGRDPFTQFDDLFRNDPFFRDAFQGMDDLFAKTFQGGAAEGEFSSGGGWGNAGERRERNRKRGWGERIAESLGANFNIQTSTSVNGRTTSSSYSTSSSSSTYTSRSTRTVIENGKRFTVQSLEKDGNKIEERYEGTTLVGRTINGVPQSVGRIAAEDL